MIGRASETGKAGRAPCRGLHGGAPTPTTSIAVRQLMLDLTRRGSQPAIHLPRQALRVVGWAGERIARVEAAA